MSPYSANKCVEEEELDLFYLEIEERILLLISEGEDEDGVMKKTERAHTAQLPCNTNSSFDLNLSWYGNSYIDQLQLAKQGRRFRVYGSENVGKKKKKPWIHEYGVRNIVPDISGRKGTGVFLPKSLAHSCG